MLRSAIDIGTNTVLLLIARITDEGRLQVLREEQRIPRLGRKVDAAKRLHPESIGRVLEALEEYQAIIEASQTEKESVAAPVVTATSAVRDAGNRAGFLDVVKQRTGWEIRLLSGDEEARFTYRGALSVLSSTKDKPVMVLDIGGGSTETAFGEAHHTEPTQVRSVDAGCVRFSERYLSGPEFEAAPEAQIAACFEAARNAFAELHHIRKAVRSAGQTPQLVGVAGTLTSLAVMHHYDDFKDTQAYDAERINGLVLSQQVVRQWRRRVFEAGPERLIRDFPLVMQGRADIYLAGLIILEAFMEYFRLPEVVVSTGGIRHGALLYARDDAARS